MIVLGSGIIETSILINIEFNFKTVASLTDEFRDKIEKEISIIPQEGIKPCDANKASEKKDQRTNLKLKNM